MELKPCPFCGGKAEPDALMIGEAGKDNATPHGHFIECQTCLTISGSAETPEEAAEAWNRRAPAVPPVEAPALVKTAKGYRYNPEREPDFSDTDWSWLHSFIPSPKGNKCRGCGLLARDSRHQGQPPWDPERLQFWRPTPSREEVVAFLESEIRRLKASPQGNPGTGGGHE